MLDKLYLGLVTLLLPLTVTHANTFDEKVNDALQSHYQAYKGSEYFSGAALSIYTPDKPIKNYYIGTVGHEKNSKNIDDNTLFEIGSITKSFTSAIVLQLEKEKQIQLTDRLIQWLPDYPKWAAVTVQSMLNMTSGLPNYSDAPLMNADEFIDLQRKWTNKQLIQYVYPPATFAPPLRSGYHYTNTGYILMAEIIEKITKHHFQTEIEARLFMPAQLKNTFYPVPSMTKEVAERLAHGYAYNPYTNPEIVGKDMKKSDMSWAGAAGGIISNTPDIINWTKALFVGHDILDKEQQQKLRSLVSTATGQPIKSTSSKERGAFGLGVAQVYKDKIGSFWFYEGSTEGFRALFMYVPKDGIIISAIFNSAVNSENDHAGELLEKAYQLTKANAATIHQKSP